MKKVLIVEDEEAILEALEAKFTAEKFKVARAKNGLEGLDVFSSFKPDLILLDILMPIMDGVTMLKKLRASEKGKKVPVIILTNLSDDEKVAEALAAGSHEYLVKSNWKIDDVVKKVKEKI
jgi:DNA-binding response OmpR family regulator